MSKTPMRPARATTGRMTAIPKNETLSEWADWCPMGKTVYGQTCIRRIELVYGQTFFPTGLWTDLFPADRPRNTEVHQNPPKSTERWLARWQWRRSSRRPPALNWGTTKHEREREHVDNAWGARAWRCGGWRGYGDVDRPAVLPESKQTKTRRITPLANNGERANEPERARRRRRRSARRAGRAWPPRKQAVEGDGGGGGSEYVRRWSTT
jgi:hypothetical protein